MSIDIYGFDAGASLDPDYAAALDEIYNLLDTERIDPATFRTVHRDLEVYKDFLRTIGNPHLAIPTVHITGTVGKGSVLILLESILREAGCRTGSTVSPHLVEVRERIRINGSPIARNKFADYWSQISDHARSRQVDNNYRTVFEVLTALAFYAINKEKVDIGLIEVGLGGNLDATNVVHPELSILSRIGLDHMKVLGDTVEAIAHDKSQIIKKKSPAVTGYQENSVLSILKDRCEETMSDLWSLQEDCKMNVHSVSSEGSVFDLTTPFRKWKNLHLTLLGRHQVENAAIAVLAADRLAHDNKFRIDENHVREGLEKAHWAGRGEIVQSDPVILLDGAHTPQGAETLVRMLKDCWPNRRCIWILGFNKDKDVERFLQQIAPHCSTAVATSVDFPRAMPLDHLEHLVRHYSISCQPSPVDSAIDSALESASSDDIIVATGSLYLVGALRRQFLHEKKTLATL